MNAYRGVIEFAGFTDTNGAHFQLFESLCREPSVCADCDLRVLINTCLSRNEAAEMLEYVAGKLRNGTTEVTLDDTRWMLSRIGGVHG